MYKTPRSFTALIMLASISLAQNVNAATINPVYEFDGVELVQTYAIVDIKQYGNAYNLDFAINHVGNLNPAEEEL